MDDFKQQIEQINERVTNMEGLYGKSNFIGQQDFNKFSNFKGRMRIPVFASLPTTCRAGEVAESGGTFYGCTTTDTWVPIGVGGAVDKGVYIPVEAMAPTITGGCASIVQTEAGSNDVDYWTLDFDKDTEEHAFFTCAGPPGWSGAGLGVVGVTLYWTSTATGDVLWGVKGVALSGNYDIDTAYGTESTAVSNIGGASKLIAISSLELDFSGSPGDLSWLQVKVSRKAADGSDTLAADARLMGVFLEFVADL